MGICTSQQRRSTRSNLNTPVDSLAVECSLIYDVAASAGSTAPSGCAWRAIRSSSAASRRKLRMRCCTLRAAAGHAAGKQDLPFLVSRGVLFFRGDRATWSAIESCKRSADHLLNFLSVCEELNKWRPFRTFSTTSRSLESLATMSWWKGTSDFFTAGTLACDHELTQIHRLVLLGVGVGRGWMIYIDKLFDGAVRFPTMVVQRATTPRSILFFENKECSVRVDCGKPRYQRCEKEHRNWNRCGTEHLGAA